jgi:hypothetical protein
MTSLYRLLVGCCLLSLVLAGVSWGQAGAPGGKGGGPSSLYNPQTAVTVSGIVISMTPPAAQKGLPYLVYLTLRTKTEKITVFLGPNLYVDKLPVKIKALDKIEVTGSKVTWEGKPVLLAAEVKIGDEVLKLREPDGVPVWSGRGRN